MKQREETRSRPFKLLFIVSLLFFLLSMIIFAGRTIIVKAKPNDGNPIVIDKGTVNEYSIPYDGKRILEPELLSQSQKFNGFVQAEDNTYTVKKTEVDGQRIPTEILSSGVGNTISSAYKTKYDNIIAMQEFSTYPYTAPARLNINATKIILLSTKGEVKDFKWVFKEPYDISLNSGDRAVYYNYFSKKNENEFTVSYSLPNSPLNTTTYKDNNGKLEIPIGGEHRPIDLSLYDVGGQGLQEQFLTFDSSLLMVGVIRMNSFEKKYYHAIKHSDGEVLDHYRFEAMSDSNNQSSISQYAMMGSKNVKAISPTEYVGVEYFNLDSGVRSVLTKWTLDETSKIAHRETLLNGEEGDEIRLSLPLSDERKLYFQLYKNKSTREAELWSLDLETFALKRINVYPAGTRLNYIKVNENEYIFSGQIQQFDGIFQKWNFFSSGVSVGVMDKEFLPISLSTIKTNFVEQKGEINNYDLVPLGLRDFFFTGNLTKEENNFIDTVQGKQYPGELEISTNRWVSQHEMMAESHQRNSVSSFLSTAEDYSPAIKVDRDLLIDVEDIDWKDNKKLENMLIKGNKAGDDSTSEKAVKVYDNHDFNYSLDPKDQAWLDARINRNPKDTSLPIDWKALGLDLSNTGPQRLTYFVTDSQMQTSSTSRWLNKVDDKTVYEENEYALRAENFDISVADVAVLDSDSAKKKANTVVWELFGGHQIVEDSKKTGKAEVDKIELQAILDTKNRFDDKVKKEKEAGNDPNFADYSDIIKPYPLTISYTDEEMGSKTLIRKITVFVTNDTTKVDKTNNTVIYGFNFRYPLKEAAALTDEKISQLSNAASWNYDVFGDQIDKEKSETFTTNRQASYQEGDNEPQTGLNNARSTRKDYQLKLTDATDKKTTNDLVRVWLASDPVSINVRQLVETPNKGLVVPKEGYFTFENWSNDQTTLRETVSAFGESGSDVTVPYKKYKLPIAYNHYYYKGQVIIPEYYEYVGYQLSKEKDGTAEIIKSELPVIDFSGNQNDYWLTIILRPTESTKKNVSTYSWDYGQKNNYSISK